MFYLSFQALAVLIEALNLVKDTDPAVENSGTDAASSLSLLPWRSLLVIFLKSLLPA